MIKQFGKFQLIARNVKTGVIQDTGWIDNLVLDNCFNFIFQPMGVNWFIDLGTGSTPPTVADTSLETPLDSKAAGTPSATKAGASTSFSSPIYSTSAGWELTYNLGEVVGNVSEIGIKRDNNLMTRALITDGAGDPTTIVLGANDILTGVTRGTLGTSAIAHFPGAVIVDGGRRQQIPGVPDYWDYLNTIDSSVTALAHTHTAFNDLGVGLQASTNTEANFINAVDGIIWENT